MGDWRAIDRRITQSWDVAQLSTLGKLLFTWGIVCADNWGILEDDPGAIKLAILAGVRCTRAQIEKQLQAMEKRGMIWRYTPNGYGPLIQFRNFDDYQPKELLRKRGRPKYPVHPDWRPRDDGAGQTIPEKAGEGRSSPEDSPKREREREEERGKQEQEQRDAAADVDLDVLERLLSLGIAAPMARRLERLEHVTCSYLEEWLEWLRDGGGRGLDNVAGYLVKRIREGDVP